MDGRRRPRLAVVYHPGSVDPLQLAAALDGDIEVVWVVERRERQHLAQLEPLLHRLGPVVEVAAEAPAAGLAGIDGVISFADHLPLAAEIAATLGLPYHTPGAALRLTDKVRQRQALAAAGLPGPRWWEVPAGLPARAALAGDLPYPVVLKPRCGLGSRCTFEVAGRRELLELTDGAGPEAWIVEELMQPAPPQRAVAGLVMVETLVLGGEARHLVVRGQFPLAPPFRISGSFVPAALDPAARASVEAATAAALRALGVGDGFCNTGVVLTAAGPRIVEVNGRLGGQLATLWGLGGGGSLLRVAAEVALGREVRAEALEAPGGGVPFAWYLQPPVEARRLDALEGVEEVAALAGVRTVVHHRRPGESLDWRDGNTSRVLTVLGVVADHRELLDLVCRIDEGLWPTWSPAAPQPAMVT